MQAPTLHMYNCAQYVGKYWKELLKWESLLDEEEEGSG